MAHNSILLMFLKYICEIYSENIGSYDTICRACNIFPDTPVIITTYVFYNGSSDGPTLQKHKKIGSEHGNPSKIQVRKHGAICGQGHVKGAAGLRGTV